MLPNSCPDVYNGCIDSLFMTKLDASGPRFGGYNRYSVSSIVLHEGIALLISKLIVNSKLPNP